MNPLPRKTARAILLPCVVAQTLDASYGNPMPNGTPCEHKHVGPSPINYGFWRCIACGDEGEWRWKYRTTGTPDPVPHAYWLTISGLLEPAAGQQMLHVSERTWSRWHSGAQPVPWAAAELLRRLIAELPPDSPAFKR